VKCLISPSHGEFLGLFCFLDILAGRIREGSKDGRMRALLQYTILAVTCKKMMRDGMSHMRNGDNRIRLMGKRGVDLSVLFLLTIISFFPFVKES